MSGARKNLCFICIFSLFASSLQADELVLLNWDEYISEAVLEQFKQASGHTVKVVHFDSDAKRDEILASPAVKQFDLTVIDNYSAYLFNESGFFTTLTPESIPNLQHVDPRWKHSCGSYGSPYFWGTLGIVYHQGKVKPAPESWQDLLLPAPQHQGHTGMLLDAIDTLVPPLKLAGHSMNSNSEPELKAAYQVLSAQQPYVLTYHHAPTFLKSEQADKLHMALAFSGDQYAMNGDDDGPWQYVIPKEGTALWIDCIAILKSSTKQSAALEFLNFLQRPDIAALNAEEVGSATTNATAFGLLPKEISQDEVLYPNESMLKQSEEYTKLNDISLHLRERIIESLSKP